MKNLTDEELDNLEARCTDGIGDHYQGYLSGQMLRLIYEIRQQRGHSQHQLTKTILAIRQAEAEDERYKKEYEKMCEIIDK